MTVLCKCLCISLNKNDIVDEISLSRLLLDSQLQQWGMDKWDYPVYFHLAKEQICKF